MNLNSKINKTTAIAVPVVLIILFTLAYFVFERTPILTTAFIVAILGSILFCLGNLYFINARGGYPWLAAIPMTLWRYIIVSTLLSAIFIIAEKTMPAFNIPVLILIIGHVVIFAYFLVMLMLMHTGKEYIDKVDEKVAVKRQFIKDLGVDLAAIMATAPDELKKDIQAVIDVARYSDPMSHESLEAMENDIQDNVTRLAQQTDILEMRSICVVLIRQLKNRNARVKALK